MERCSGGSSPNLDCRYGLTRRRRTSTSGSRSATRSWAAEPQRFTRGHHEGYGIIFFHLCGRLRAALRPAKRATPCSGSDTRARIRGESPRVLALGREYRWRHVDVNVRVEPHGLQRVVGSEITVKLGGGGALRLLGRHGSLMLGRECTVGLGGGGALVWRGA